VYFYCCASPHFINSNPTAVISCACMCVCGSSAADTENMNPDKAVDSVVRISSVADIESVSVGDRQKMYNPNHYQDDVVHVRVV